MTFKDINTMIQSIGLPSNYYQWPAKEAPALPYILFYYPSREDFKADNTNYAKFTQLNIEFYSENKDFEMEAKIEEILEENDLYYDKEEQYIDTDKMYEVLYVINVLIN